MEVTRENVMSIPLAELRTIADDYEAGHGDICDILDYRGHGVVCTVEHVAVVRTTYHATLPPADDADSDDDWEVEAATADEARAALEAEQARRKALTHDDNIGMDDTHEHDCGVDVCVCADPA